MKKLLIAILGIVLMSSLAMATSVEFNWDGSGIVDANMENSVSGASVSGSGNAISGVFKANDNGYDRVEVSELEAAFNNGGYEFSQTNTLTQGNTGSSFVGAVVQGTEGFMDLRTDTWRRGNTIGTHGYTGWSGTDSPMVGASGNYMMGIGASFSGDFDSSYVATINGEGTAGIGTWNAGSNSVLASNGNINGDVLVKGEGNADFNQEFNNVGSIDGEFHWN